MRLLFVAPFYKPAYVYGGPVNSLSALCEELVRQGVDVEVFTTDANGHKDLPVPRSTRINVDGVPVTYFPLTHDGLGAFYSEQQVRAIKSGISQFDLVVLENVWGHVDRITGSICRRKRVPYVIIPRGNLLPWSLKQHGIKKNLYISLFGKRLLRKAAGIHCTDQIEAEYIRRLGVKGNVFIAPNGLDLKQFASTEKGVFRKLLCIPEAAPVLLFLARIHHKKRPDIAVHTFQAVREKHPNVHLVLAGPDEENLVSGLVSDIGTTNVHVTGLLNPEEVKQIMVDSTIFLMPSENQSENFGMAALEAMASGLPILMSDGVPIGRVVEKVQAGAVVPCDASVFGEKAVELLANLTELRAMGLRGQKAALETYDISFVTRNILAEYRKLVPVV